MIEGGWNFIWAAYAITLGALLLLFGVVLWRAGVWAQRARELDKK
jgi:hypothetical protein